MRRYDHTVAKHVSTTSGEVVSQYYAIVTRDGGGVWTLKARNHLEARDLGKAWLDAHKPGWEAPDAYSGEL